ncbi:MULTISPECIES: GH36-type glycosyl hydrolase domain-containing protein [Bacillus]|uniref:Cellobiose phosphorylase n=1 Tax=Bacillus infantis NRRL B-14911 TaxID=1367477 RepID=U5L8J7_9BACI|nr:MULTISPECIES: glycosyl hydrolase family 65 protein [Bacillus]AGX02977.1 cellobiose phosphorylase [Bacillus infantis NRRL B-14911]
MNSSTINIQSGDLSFSFMKSGDVFKISHKDTMINQLLSNPIDGSLNNIYLRIFNEREITAIPLLGIRSESAVSASGSSIRWTGEAEGIRYKVTFTLTDNQIWFWDVALEGSNKEIDLIYGQDIGLADEAAVRSNEAYTSQYIDHSVFNDELKGYVVCSRQNQPQQGQFPYLQQGSLGRSAGFSTDGFQFFGLSYKTTDKPAALTKPALENKVSQYEFAYTALQTEKTMLNGRHRFVFYGLFKENHPDAVTRLEYQEEIQSAWEELNRKETVFPDQMEQVKLSSRLGAPIEAIDLTLEEIDQYFPGRILEEKSGDRLLSFFTDSYEHIVLKEKEELVERPHGHILMNGNNDRVREDVLSTTSYMYGVFNSQLAVGNSSMNKMMTNVRNPLNLLKTSGQRIYIEIDNRYRLLTMPSLFEMGFNYSRWYYKTNDETFIITVFTTVGSKDVQLDLKAQSGKYYRYMVTAQISMNQNEYAVPFHCTLDNDTVCYTAAGNSDSSGIYPDLSYRLTVRGADFQLLDESELASGTDSAASLAVLNIDSASDWTMLIQGDLSGEFPTFEKRDFSKEAAEFRKYYKVVLNGFHLSHQQGDSGEIEKFNALAHWYTHNMLVHFSTPHGLEQYGGAAWGTRDVSQGPAEYFMATQKYETVRDIILTIYTHQYDGTGSWPQWFMFDQYTKIQQPESHGDIIVWPLKLVSDYLEATGDFSILQEQIPYMDQESFTFTENHAALLDHVNKQVAYMERHFLHDTFLPSYDDGDWDDTLQPANQLLKKYMVSSWTVSLMFQSIKKMAEMLSAADVPEASKLSELAQGIKEDFNRYILSSSVIPGFVYMEDPEKAEFMLHPTDTDTGIQYRLLPMQRGIISEIFTPEQAAAHYKLIKEHLTFPDGVRLMNRPANYAGGVSTHFKRAEQASNFGREIGLQYVHAHIRFIEALAKLGVHEEIWHALSVINPIKIQDAVPNAALRQSNAYFSSSDGKFDTRYEAQKDFNKLKDGTVPVKGGWRIYSSGPGIYLNQLISNVLGIRQKNGSLELDPVLPDSLDGLEFRYNFMNRPITFIYHLAKGKRTILINGIEAEAESSPNPYRGGGAVIPKSTLDDLLNSENNRIDIYM